MSFTVMKSRSMRAVKRSLDLENKTQVKGYERERDGKVSGGVEWVYMM